ncbi:hypothetical protein NA57DRAFT_52925 [Rhizodiscina lignyota]|uniref:Uncharacterized protein n=1 Tax=Rhizodiscina lignyota TaxID=1504668 RepID=A0A9P4MFC0_9PEZI|nr:hypothetical protein NA57DRAFT_52925 [Rhizodiscina lignyota]
MSDFTVGTPSNVIMPNRFKTEYRTNGLYSEAELRDIVEAPKPLDNKLRFFEGEKNEKGKVISLTCEKAPNDPHTGMAHLGAWLNSGELVPPEEYPPGLQPPPGLMAASRISNTNTSVDNAADGFHNNPQNTSVNTMAGMQFNVEAPEFIMPQPPPNTVGMMPNANVNGAPLGTSQPSAVHGYANHHYPVPQMSNGYAGYNTAGAHLPVANIFHSPQWIPNAPYLPYFPAPTGSGAYRHQAYVPAPANIVVSSVPHPTHKQLAVLKYPNHTGHQGPYKQGDYSSGSHHRNNSSSTTSLTPPRQHDGSIPCSPPESPLSKSDADTNTDLSMPAKLLQMFAAKRAEDQDTEKVEVPLLRQMFAKKQEENNSSVDSKASQRVNVPLLNYMFNKERGEGRVSRSSIIANPAFNIELIEASMTKVGSKASLLNDGEVTNDALPPVERFAGSEFTPRETFGNIINTHDRFRERFGIGSAQLLLDDCAKMIIPKGNSFFDDELSYFEEDGKADLDEYLLSQRLGLDEVPKPADWGVRPPIVGTVPVMRSPDVRHTLFEYNASKGNPESNNEPDNTHESSSEHNDSATSPPSSPSNDSPQESNNTVSHNSTTTMPATEPLVVNSVQMQYELGHAQIQDIIGGPTKTGIQDTILAGKDSDWAAKARSIMPSEEDEEDEMLRLGAEDDRRRLANLMKMEEQAEHLTVKTALDFRYYGPNGSSGLCAEVHEDDRVTISEKPPADMSKYMLPDKLYMGRSYSQGNEQPLFKSHIYGRYGLGETDCRLRHPCPGYEYCATCLVDELKANFGWTDIRIRDPFKYDEKVFFHTGRVDDITHEDVYFTPGDANLYSFPSGTSSSPVLAGLDIHAPGAPYGEPTSTLDTDGFGAIEQEAAADEIDETVSHMALQPASNPYGYPEDNLASLMLAASGQSSALSIAEECYETVSEVALQPVSNPYGYPEDNLEALILAASGQSSALVPTVSPSMPQPDICGLDPNAVEFVPFDSSNDSGSTTTSATELNIFDLSPEELKAMLEDSAALQDTHLSRELDPRPNVCNAPIPAPAEHSEKLELLGIYEMPQKTHELILYEEDSPLRKILDPESQLHENTAHQALIRLTPVIKPHALAAAVPYDSDSPISSEDEEDNDMIIITGDDGEALPAPERVSARIMSSETSGRSDHHSRVDSPVDGRVSRLALYDDDTDDDEPWMPNENLLSCFKRQAESTHFGDFEQCFDFGLTTLPKPTFESPTTSRTSSFSTLTTIEEVEEIEDIVNPAIVDTEDTKFKFEIPTPIKRTEKNRRRKEMLKKRTLQCLESFQDDNATGSVTNTSPLTTSLHPKPFLTALYLVVSSLLMLFASIMIESRMSKSIVANYGILWHVITIWGELLTAFSTPM